MEIRWFLSELARLFDDGAALIDLQSEAFLLISINKKI